MYLELHGLQMNEYTAYILDTATYIAQPLFTMEAETPDIVLTIARERLVMKGLPIAPPYCIQVLRRGMAPMDMVRRYARVNAGKDKQSAGFLKRLSGISYGIKESSIDRIKAPYTTRRH